MLNFNHQISIGDIAGTGSLLYVLLQSAGAFFKKPDPVFD